MFVMVGWVKKNWTEATGWLENQCAKRKISSCAICSLLSYLLSLPCLIPLVVQHLQPAAAALPLPGLSWSHCCMGCGCAEGETGGEFWVSLHPSLGVWREMLVARTWHLGLCWNGNRDLGMTRNNQQHLQVGCKSLFRICNAALLGLLCPLLCRVLFRHPEGVLALVKTKRRAGLHFCSRDSKLCLSFTHWFVSAPFLAWQHLQAGDITNKF